MFNGQKNSVDKVNMSLDDLIKFNKKQSKQTKAPGNNNVKRNNNNGRPSPQKNKQIGQNQQRQNGQSNHQQGNRNQNRRQRPNQKFQNNQTVAKKPFGLLNRSRSIRKNRVQPKFVQPAASNVSNKQQKKVAPVLQRRPMQAQFVGNRRRVPNNNKVKRANINHNQPRNSFNNRSNSNKPKNANAGQLSTITIIKPSAAPINKSPQRARQSPRKPTASVQQRSKITMQSARKNVQKAKRFLIAKKQPVKQLMTQRYASKLGLAASSKTGLVRPRVQKAKPAQQKVLQQPRKKSAVKEMKSKMLTISIANKKSQIMKAKAVKAAQKKQVAVAKPQAKRPILNRSRPQGLSGTTSSRMVFF